MLASSMVARLSERPKGSSCLTLQSLVIHVEMLLAHPQLASLVSCRLSPTPAAHLLQEPCDSSPAARVAEAACEPLWELLLRL